MAYTCKEKELQRHGGGALQIDLGLMQHLGTDWKVQTCRSNTPKPLLSLLLLLLKELTDTLPSILRPIDGLSHSSNNPCCRESQGAQGKN